MSRVVMALQKAETFLPDPEKEGGMFRSDQRKTDDVIKVVDELFFSMKEWYDAEITVAQLNGVKKTESKGGAKGELGAGSTSESGTSQVSAA
jgi:hypothetical protein